MLWQARGIELELTVPEGCQPGDLIYVDLPVEGLSMNDSSWFDYADHFMNLFHLILCETEDHQPQGPPKSQQDRSSLAWSGLKGWQEACSSAGIFLRWSIRFRKSIHVTLLHAQRDCRTSAMKLHETICKNGSAKLIMKSSKLVNFKLSARINPRSNPDAA